MRIFKTKWFERFARKERIADPALRQVIDRAAQGTVDADLGGGVIKQRVARPGQGRSGGFRVIVLYRASERSVFAFGFAKSEKDTLDDKELAAFRKLAGHYFQATDPEIEKLIKAGELKEVQGDGDKKEVPKRGTRSRS